jgi:hypothetical protein
LPRGQLGFLVGKQLNFGDDDRGKCHGAGAKLIEENVDGGALISNRALFLFDLARQIADRGELVLDLLKSGEHGLPVIGDALPIGGARGVDLRRRQAAVEKRFRCVGANRRD